MNNDKINKEIFKEVGAHIAETAKTVRRTCGKSKAQLSLLLKNEYDWNSETTEELIAQIESDERPLSFEEFVDVCDAFGFLPEKILECAKLVKRESEDLNPCSFFCKGLTLHPNFDRIWVKS